MSIVDGGSFKCYGHGDKLFETTSPEEWEEHIHDGKHVEEGSAPCAVCGNITSFTNKVVGKKPLCDKCKEDLTK